MLHRRRMTRGRALGVPELGFWAGHQGEAFVGWWVLGPVLTGPSAESAASDRAELGYRLRPPFWRQGLAKEGSSALIDHGFADLGLSTVIAQTMAVNEASRATMVACGLSYRRHYPWTESEIAGAEHGAVEYAISRAHWWARQAGRGECEPA